MFACPTCGFKNHEGALFCESCGAYFHTGGTLATDVLKAEQTSKPRPSGFPTPAAGAAEEKLSLVLISEGDGHRFVVQPRGQTALIGRNDRKAKVIVDIDPTGESGQGYGVSRRHARVHYLNGIYLLEDLESLNGTYLNERKLRPYLPEVLHDGDQVKLGDLTLKVSLEGKV